MNIEYIELDNQKFNNDIANIDTLCLSARENLSKLELSIYDFQKQTNNISELKLNKLIDECEKLHSFVDFIETYSQTLKNVNREYVKSTNLIDAEINALKI